MTNKNGVWQEIFNQIGNKIQASIDNYGFYDITANQLKKFSNPLKGPDTRNLVKFDRSYDLPSVFKENTNSVDDYINIMPLGHINKEYTYRLGRFNAYAPLNINESQKPEIIKFPDIQTITPNSIPSENASIDAAFSSGMLERAFSNSNNRFLPVLHGRMGSGPMNFFIGTNPPQRLEVDSAQIEIDATFENEDSIVVIEAKAKTESDFLVRQLFYPYYVIRHRDVTKPVQPAFLSLLGGNYYFNEYVFDEPNNYSTIRMINQHVFRFHDSSPITLKRIVNIFKNVSITKEPENIVFPQANSYLKFVKALNALNEAFEDEDNENNGLSKKEIVTMFAYTERQGDYYGNLIQYLGLCFKDHTFYVINDTGKNLLRALDTNDGKLQLIQLILQHQPFREIFKFLLENPQKQSKALTYDDKIIIITKIKSYMTKSYSLETMKRRVESCVSLVRTAIFDAIDA